jgi:hypothetical protein
MNKKVVLGMSALALIFVLGSCATETKLVKGTPAEERASLYLIGDDASLVKIDGKKLGLAFYRPAQRAFFSSKIRGTDPKKTRDNEVNFSMNVTAGEHTITVSQKKLIGSTDVEGTYQFEGGKRYLLRVTTPSSFANASSIGEALGNVGSAAKEELSGNFILVLAETYRGTDVFIEDFGHTGSKRQLPRYPDKESTLLGPDREWVRPWINISSSANKAAEETTDEPAEEEAE